LRLENRVSLQLAKLRREGSLCCETGRMTSFSGTEIGDKVINIKPLAVESPNG